MLSNDLAEVKRWINKIRDADKIANIVNFLGQSALHMALAPSSGPILDFLLARAALTLKDKQDRWGFTPLMYAVAMGYRDAALMLIQHGADLSVRAHHVDRDTWGLREGNEYDFIDCAFIWSHEKMVWDVFHALGGNTATSNPSYDIWPRLSEQMAKLVLPGQVLTAQMKEWTDQYWETLLSVSGPADLDFTFGSDEKTLGSLIRS